MLRYRKSKYLGQYMAYDPLSRATRTTRTSLLTVCAVSLSVHLFDLENEKFKVLDVPIPDKFLVFALAIGVVLLSISFVLYIYDDVRGRDSVARDRAELGKVVEQLSVTVGDISVFDKQIGDVLCKFKSNVEQGVYLNARDTGELEYLKYCVSKLLQQQLQLRARENNLTAALEFPHSNPLSGLRFCAVEVGIPIFAIILVVLGWFDLLSWLELILQKQSAETL